MIRTMVCTHDHQLRHDLSASEIRPILADEQSLLWLDLANPTPDDLRLIAGEFDFHPLALEDATKPHQRPKIDRYDRFYFLVFYAIESRDDGSRIDEHELDIFLGPNYLITVHSGPIAEIGEGGELCSVVPGSAASPSAGDVRAVVTGDVPVG